MGKRYTRENVQLHSDRGPARPAINVKCHNFPTLQIAEHFKCSQAVANRAAEWAWNLATRCFWDHAGEEAREIFGKGVTVYSEGRSGGWLVVEGLAPLESWNARDLGKWRRFELAVKAEIADLASWEHVQEDITANRWAEENAEEYNFRDTKDGGHICLADVPRCLHCAGRS